jgi:hypothetical protein
MPEKALSIQQPFAHLILTGRKRLENRTWSTPYRDCLWIHATAPIHYGCPNGGTTFAR